MNLFRASLCLLLLHCFFSRAADVKPAAPQKFTHRVHGLCCAELESNLRAVVKEIPDVELVSVNIDKAEVTFEYDPATLCAERLKQMSKSAAATADLPKLAAEELTKLLNQNSSGIFGILPPSTIPADKLTLVEIHVAGLDCKACSFAAYESIYKIDGVDRATASFKKGLVTAWIDPSKTNRAALETALKKKNVDVKPSTP